MPPQQLSHWAQHSVTHWLLLSLIFHSLAGLQVDIEPQELQDMIAEFDRDGDNAISEEEFKAIVTAMED
jgi:Ca2+-binding EF-hand superfamily protein